MKRKTLSKYKVEEQDAIINIQPGAKAILYEQKGETDMTTNEMLKIIMNNVSELKDDVSGLKDDMKVVIRRLDNIENTPTMQRELNSK